MAHKHSVYDTDAHFSINPFTRAIKNESTSKVAVIQHDHNSERFTFEIPRLVDGHDMSVCDRVEVHYINMDSENKDNISADIYEVDDLQVSPDDRDFVICSWLLSQNATKYAGSLNFLVRFVCLDGEKVAYAWHTAVFTGISVSSGILNNAEEIVEPYVDVLAQWKADLFGVGDTEEQRLLSVSAEQQAAIAAKGQAVLESIPDEYEALQTGVDTLFNSVASGIRGNLSGAVVRADDVSPVEHRPNVRIHGKNLWNNAVITSADGKFTNNGDGTITIHGGEYYCRSTQRLSEICPQLRTGDTVKFTISTTGNPYVYLNGVALLVMNGYTLTITEEMLTSYVTLYGASETDESYNEPHDIQYIQLEYGTAASEYTPYIDPTTVTVRRCGKNLIPFPYASLAQDYNGIAFTPNDDGSVTINGTATNDGTSFMLVSTGVGIRQFLPAGTYFLSCPEINGTDVYLSIFFYDNNETTVFSSTSGKNKAFTLEKGQYYGLYFRVYGGVTVNNITVHPQIECGDAATSYEKYNGAEHIPAADGTVSGVTSVSPTMTILTDTEGAIVECEYIVDTKTYIDNKIKELMEGVTA